MSIVRSLDSYLQTDLWRATTSSPVNITENFTSKIFTNAIKHPKSGKASSPDSVCPELMLHAGVSLKF